MGNNTSIQQQNSQHHPIHSNSSNSSKSSRKSTSSTNNNTSSKSGQIRKSTATGKHNQTLDDEFSDLILHQVIQKNNKQQPLSHHSSSEQYNQFTNDLIEDEFNELNEKLVETESTSLSRNIIPENTHTKHLHQMSNSMDLDENYNFEGTTNHDVTSPPFPQDSDDIEIEREFSETPTPDLSKVDFTKITNQQPQSAQSESSSSYFSQKPPAATHALSAASVARAASHTPSPRIIEYNNNNNNNTNNSSNIFPTKKRNIANGNNLLIPIEIKWVNTNKEYISKISIIGSFSNWRDVIRLYPSPQHPNEYTTTLTLPLGVHKLLYIINNEYRVSDQLPTATDQEGLFFNWFEVIDDTHLFNHSSNQHTHIGASTDYDANIIQNQWDSEFYNQPRQAGKYETNKIQEKSMDLLHKISKENSSQFEHVEYYESSNDNSQPQSQFNSQPPTPNESNEQTFPTDLQQVKYSSEIPEMFINYDYFKFKPQDYELPEPPQLPPHLNNVLLNKINSNSNSSSNVNSNPNLLPTNFSQSPSGSSQHNGQSHSQNQGFSHKRPPLRRADSSYYASNKESYHLSIPNHVILNHLMTTSIKNDVLTVACITRYSGKFVTQIMHSPADTNK